MFYIIQKVLDAAQAPFGKVDNVTNSTHLCLLKSHTLCSQESSNDSWRSLQDDPGIQAYLWDVWDVSGRIQALLLEPILFSFPNH